MCWADTQVKPIDAEDHAIGLVKYENGAIGQFEVSWTFRGGLDLRDEVMGTEGTIWINNFLRTGFEMFTTGKAANYVAEKAESNTGWLFPVGDELNELGYNHMFMDMFDSLEQKRHTKGNFLRWLCREFRFGCSLQISEIQTVGTCSAGYLARENGCDER